MQHTRLAEWDCSIARALDIVGEWWTLLILRDAMRGTTRFDDFHDSLGMARSVLTARLKRLTDAGVLEKLQYREHPPRHEYRLTDKGRALFAVVAALQRWGDEWTAGPAGPPALLVHEPCGHAIRPEFVCPDCGTEVTLASTHVEAGPGAATRS